MPRYFSRLLLVLFTPAAIAMASCGTKDDGGVGAALPVPTSIPAGAPSAEGARFDPPAAPTMRGPTPQKIGGKLGDLEPPGGLLDDEEDEEEGETPKMPVPTPINPTPTKSKGTKL